MTLLVMPGKERPSEPVRNHDASDPLALALFNQLRDLGVDARRFVYFALKARSNGTPTDRYRLVVTALRLALVDMPAGGYLSRGRYDAWRQGQERSDEWPSSTMVRNTLGGSWSKVLDALGLEPGVDVLARRYFARSAFTREELLAAIARCAEELNTDRLTFGDYRNWAIAQRDAGHRVSISHPTMIRAFGSWGAATATAELRCGAAHTDRPCALDRANYSEERLVEVLMAAAVLHGGGAITRDAYRRTRLSRAQYAQDASASPSANAVGGGWWPSDEVFINRFGSWAHALFAAGLIDNRQLRFRAPRLGRLMRDEDLLHFLTLAIREIGAGIRRSDYRRWRRTQLERRSPDAARVPSDATISVRFGDWELAKRRAIERAAASEEPSNISAFEDAE